MLIIICTTVRIILPFNSSQIISLSSPRVSSITTLICSLSYNILHLSSWKIVLLKRSFKDWIHNANKFIKVPSIELMVNIQLWRPLNRRSILNLSIIERSVPPEVFLPLLPSISKGFIKCSILSIEYICHYFLNDISKLAFLYLSSVLKPL